MLCTKPFVQGARAYGCGQCVPCRINKRRLWCHRLVLESRLHACNAFVTLTYAEEHVPRLQNSSMTLRPEDLQKWLKRLRERMEPQKIRFFACGEYGDESQRPHYHAALFNFPGCARGYSGLAPRGNCRCASCKLVADTWGLGHISVGQLNRESAQYLAGYVVKKMTGKDDARLQGRKPEFARMSLRPGIGAGAMPEVAKASLAVDYVSRTGDAPGGLRHGSRIMPLGRYLRGKLRLECGVGAGARSVALDDHEKEMLALLQASKSDKEAVSLGQQVRKKSEGRIASMVARAKIMKGRKTL